MRIIFALLCIAWMGLLAILGFSPNSDLAPFIPIHNDLFLHFIGFLVLTVLYYFTWELTSMRKNILLTVWSILPVCIGSEFFQAIMPYRSFDPKDIFFNLIGFNLGLGIAVGVDYWRMHSIKIDTKKLAAQYIRLEEGVNVDRTE